jgi:hypothetical protein
VIYVDDETVLMSSMAHSTMLVERGRVRETVPAAAVTGVMMWVIIEELPDVIETVFPAHLRKSKVTRNFSEFMSFAVFM